MTEFSPSLQSFSTPEELAVRLSSDVAELLARAVTSRKEASMVVSGGSTPAPFFRKLSGQDIEWSAVTITLADERWVDTTDTTSNELLVRSLLLQNRAEAARFVGLKNDATSAAKGVHGCHRELQSIRRPFDVVILGMGDDGHTASLFPGSGGLKQAADPDTTQSCIAMTAPVPPISRISMTLATLLDSRSIILHITGSRKKEILEQALAGGEAAAMPVRWILRQQNIPVSIYWAP